MKRSRVASYAMTWWPHCPHCGGPGPYDGRTTDVAAARRIFIPWRCTTCGTRNWLAESRWVPVG